MINLKFCIISTAANRWDFMSCETDFAKTRGQSSNSSGKQLRCFKKRIIQQNKYSVQPYTDWGKKIYMIQNEVSFTTYVCQNLFFNLCFVYF